MQVRVQQPPEARIYPPFRVSPSRPSVVQQVHARPAWVVHVGI